MNSEIIKYRNKLQDLKSKKSLLEEQVENYDKEIAKLKNIVGIYMEAKAILVSVSSATQNKFIDYIKSLTTVALQSVFGSEFNFIVKYEKNKDSWECIMMVQEGDDEPYFPKNEMGSGVLDIISLALRVVLWSIHKPVSRAFMYIDEPMKAIGKGILLERTILMMKNISDKLGIQFIINTHEPEIANLSDRTFGVIKEKKISEVQIIFDKKGNLVKKKSKLNRLN